MCECTSTKIETKTRIKAVLVKEEILAKVAWSLGAAYFLLELSNVKIASEKKQTFVSVNLFIKKAFKNKLL